MLLFCDTDVLIQIFITRQTKLLKWFRTEYGLEAVVVPEVENEIAWHAKFKDRFDPDLKKAIAAGVITVFDYSDVQSYSFLPPPQASIAAAAIAQVGRDYVLKVGLGEAYSHAASVHLGMPFLSHDISAIRTLTAGAKRVAAPTLRFFDLLCLARSKNYLTEKECDQARKALNNFSSTEWLPQSFLYSSFAQGFSGFDRRLFDIAESSGKPPACLSYRDPLFLVPV